MAIPPNSDATNVHRHSTATSIQGSWRSDAGSMGSNVRNPLPDVCSVRFRTSSAAPAALSSKVTKRQVPEQAGSATTAGSMAAVPASEQASSTAAEHSPAAHASGTSAR